jgi:hypothetical protein
MLCCAIESLEKFNTDTKGDSGKIFNHFFKTSNSHLKKELIDSIEVLNKNIEVSDDKKFDLIIGYIYYLRNRFLHEGVHFEFCNELIKSKFNIFDSDNTNYLIKIKLKFGDLTNFYKSTISLLNFEEKI